MLDPRNILKRHPENPLIHPRDFPGVRQIFNPGPAKYDGKIILLLSVCKFDNPHGGISWVAESEDGINFDIKQESFIQLYDREYPYNIVCGHTIDNRITQIGDTYYIVTPATTNNYDKPLGVLGKTKDFKTYEPIDVITLPKNRGASLFPEKIGGKYYKIDRPGAGTDSFSTMWISSSPDLIHWGSFRPLAYPGSGGVTWTSTKLGPTPPVKTKAGWLCIYHGVYTPCDGAHYCIGAMLLDLEDPTKILGRTKSWLLCPEERYETNGYTDNVVFPCGVLIDEEKDDLLLYYGAADTCICLASGSLNAVIEACLTEA